MNIRIALVAAAIPLMGSVAVYATDSDTQYPGMYVKDSAITTKVKTKLLAKHPTLLSEVQVNTDHDGNVWLSGKVPTEQASQLAEEIARDTTGVKSVHNHIVVSPP
jgi:hyperosmotically inducible periplasmic protein